MSEQPKLPEGVGPLSMNIAEMIGGHEAANLTEAIIPLTTLRYWLGIAGEWEKLAAEFQAARNEDEPLIALGVKVRDAVIESVNFKHRHPEVSGVAACLGQETVAIVKGSGTVKVVEQEPCRFCNNEHPPGACVKSCGTIVKE